MKKIYLLLISLIIVSTYLYTDNKIILAKKGVLDLNSWNFNKDGITALNGEWEFYWNQLLEPSDFKNKTIIKKNYMKIPGIWNNFIYDGKKINKYGYATFRLNILTDDITTLKGISIGKIKSNYMLWINDKLVIINGIVGSDEKSSKPFILPKIAQIMDNNRNLEIIIQISNFSLDTGGLTDAIYLGVYNKIHRNYDFYVNFYLFIFGCLFIISFYNFGLFFLRKKDISSLFFSIMCSFFSLRTLLIGPKYLIWLQPEIMKWEIATKLEHLSLYITVLFVTLLINSYYSEESSKKISGLIIFVSVIFSLTVVFFNSKIYSFLLFFWEIFVLLNSIYIVSIIVKALMNHKKGSVVILLGGLIFIATGINDILLSRGLIVSVELSSIGLLIFVFLHSFIISMLFSNTYYELEDLTQNLEKKVIQRTKEIEDTNKKLKQIDEAKTTFFANMSHELRTPLTLIISPIDAIIKGQYGNKIDKDNEIFEIIKNSGNRLSHIVSTLLDIVKIENNKMNLKKQNTDIIQLLQYYVLQIKPSVSSRNIKLNFINNASSIESSIDRNLFEIAFFNLIINAFKYTPDNGSITIQLDSDDCEYCISISDTGIGIPKEKLNSIFIRFQQVEEFPKVKYYGSGIGLSLTKEIIELHQGKIFVESKENEGTKFKIKLQIEKDDNDLLSLQVNEVNPYLLSEIYFEDNFLKKEIEISKNKNTILMVDDNINLLRYMEINLKEKYNLLLSKSGKDALLKIRNFKGKINLIISDIMMESMDGWNLYEIISNDNNINNIPFIFLTAKASCEERIKSLKEGIIDYINKPFYINELIEKIENIINRENKIRTKIKQEIQGRLLKTLDEENLKENKNYNIKEKLKHSGITTREVDIIELLIKGLQYKEIGFELKISDSTVSTHIGNIYKKLGIQNRIELINLLNT